VRLRSNLHSGDLRAAGKTGQDVRSLNKIDQRQNADARLVAKSSDKAVSEWISSLVHTALQP
jgi:hypothetical protein